MLTYYAFDSIPAGNGTLTFTGCPFTPVFAYYRFKRVAANTAHSGVAFHHSSLQRCISSSSVGGGSSSNAFFNRYEANVFGLRDNEAWILGTSTLTADGATISVSSFTTDYPVECHAVFFDAEPALATFYQSDFTANSTALADANGAAFVGKFVVTRATSPPGGLGDAAAGAAWGMGIGEALGARFYAIGAQLESAQSSPAPSIFAVDSTEPVHTGPIHNASVQTFGATLDSSFRVYPTAVALELQNDRISGGATGIPRTIDLLVGERGNQKAASFSFRLNATNGIQQIRGLGFQPKFIELCAAIGVTAWQSGADFVTQESGISRGFWVEDGAAEFNYGHIDHSLSSSANITPTDSANILNFTGGSFTGAASINALDADGFDLEIIGTSGETHCVVGWAIGEPGAPETELTPEPLTLGWSLDDATITVGETSLAAEDLSLDWFVDDATLTQEEQPLSIDDVTLQWAVQDVNVTAANVIAPDNIAFGWSLANTNVNTEIIEPEPILYGWGIQNATVVQEEQSLTADALTLGWSLDNAQVIGAGVVAPDDVALGWSLNDASLVIAEQSLTPTFVALTWQLGNVTVQQAETALDVDSLALGWTLDNVILPVEAISPAALSLEWSLGFAQVFEAMPEEAVQLVRVVRPESVDVKVFSSTRGVKK